MSDSMVPLKRASFTVHVCSILGLSRDEQEHDPVPLTRLVKRLDEALDLFDSDTRFQHLTLNGEVAALEDYLTIRPENFERVEQAIQDYHLLVGPLYVNQPTQSLSRECLIRNLLIGLQIARAFGPPMLVAYLNHTPLYDFIPQILRSFGITFAVAQQQAQYPTENNWKGDDGTEITLVFPALDHTSTQSIQQRRNSAGAENESGHLLALQGWSLDLPASVHLEQMRSLFVDLNSLRDERFHSNLTVYARFVGQSTLTSTLIGDLLEDAQPTDDFESMSDPKFYFTERQLIHQLDPLSAWAECLETCPDEQHVRQPQHLIRTLWKRYFKLLSQEENPDDEEDNPVELACKRLSQLALQDIGAHVNTTLLKVQTEFALVVFNPNPYPASATLHLRKAKVYDSDGKHPGRNFRVDLPAYGLSAFASSEKEDGFVLSYNGGDVPVQGVFTTIHEGTLPLSASLVQMSDEQFLILAIKLPEDVDRTGLIVRGYSEAEEPIWITLTTFRAFKTVEVVTMDETPTGGQIAPEADGAVTFRAFPQRILTFWLHD